MKRTKPPFRADHVGSLLRPPRSKRRASNTPRARSTPPISRRVEDREIERVDQEAGGSRAQGGHRRRVPPLLVAPRLPLGSRRRRTLRDGAGHRVRSGHAPGPRAHGHRQGRLLQPSHDRAFQVRRRAHLAHAEDHDPGARRRSMAGRLRRRSSRPSIPTLEQFFTDLGRAYRKAVRAFADAGCRYLQLDEVFIAMLCDPELSQDPGATAATIRKARRALRRADQRRDVGHPLRHDHHHASVPRQLPIDLHGRGGLRRRSQEILFDQHQGAWLFHGVRHRTRRQLRAAARLPKGKQVVLGLVTTKTR